MRKEICVEHGLLAATYKLLTMVLHGNITNSNKDFLNPYQYSKTNTTFRKLHRNFDVLLTVRLSIILVINQLNVQIMVL